MDVSPVYQDFEPFCEWKRGEGLLIVHVPEFTKAHLRVQVNTSGTLKISGERPLEGHKPAMRSRFYKEIRLPEECNINEIQAKLCDGKLTITMPRTPNNNIPPLEPLTHEKPRINRPDQRGPSYKKIETPLHECVFNEDEEEDINMIGFGKFKVTKKIAVGVGVGVAVVAIAAIGALMVFKPETCDSYSSAEASNLED